VECPPLATPTDRPMSISLVLGSGGARGYAHIGVIEELIAQGFDIQSISGSSMGSLVGGVHAAGKLDAFRDWVVPLARLDVLRMVDLTLVGGGFIKGDRIIRALRDLIGDIDIEALPISYTAVAVDLDEQREVWFSKGSLFDAIRASIAIPTVFRPHHYQGRLFVDGGLLNPLPVSPTLRDFTDATIAVDVNAAAEPLDGVRVEGSSMKIAADERPAQVDNVNDGTSHSSRRRKRHLISSLIASRGLRNSRDPSILELFSRSLDTVQETITRLKLAAQPPDLLISIPRNVCTMYEFHRAEHAIELGRQRAREALARWPRPQRLRNR
jgi:NTE family protein